MGSKNRLAGEIVPILQRCIDTNNITEYYEPCVGGANVIDKIRCERRFGSDRSDTLIALLTQARDNFDGVLKEGNRELWDKGKAYIKDGIMPDDMTLAEIGAMEFLASFNNGGFPRGYAKPKDGRDPYAEAYRNLEVQAPHLKGIDFRCCNYWELPDTEGALVYIDPPYANTKQYQYANAPKFDYDKFWQWVRERSLTNWVFVSEQTAPDDFDVIWEKEVKRTCSSDNKFKATEKLFRYSKGLK